MNNRLLVQDVITITWLFDACSCILWGCMFKSIILSILGCPSASASEMGPGEALWFCWFSPIVSLGGRFCPLLVSPGSTGFKAGSSRRPGLSPGNYRTIKECEVCAYYWKQKSMIPFSPQWQTSTLCLSRRYLPCVLFPPTWTIMSHCKHRELPSTSQ